MSFCKVSRTFVLDQQQAAGIKNFICVMNKRLNEPTHIRTIILPQRAVQAVLTFCIVVRGGFACDVRSRRTNFKGKQNSFTLFRCCTLEVPHQTERFAKAFQHTKETADMLLNANERFAEPPWSLRGAHDTAEESSSVFTRFSLCPESEMTGIEMSISGSQSR